VWAVVVTDLTAAAAGGWGRIYQLFNRISASVRRRLRMKRNVRAYSFGFSAAGAFFAAASAFCFATKTRYDSFTS
jgi:hypothetical protein